MATVKSFIVGLIGGLFVLSLGVRIGHHLALTYKIPVLIFGGV